MALDLSFDFGDMVRLQASIRKLGDLPQKVVTKAAGKGATIVGRAVKAAAPRGQTRQLSKGFKRKAEKSRVKGKKVYHYAMDSAKNDIFQKSIKNPGEAGGKSEHAYYPASVEYGFLTRSKGGGLTYVQGTHFAQKAAESAEPEARGAIIKTLKEELDKEWKKK